jgi:hypothetical protein
VDRSTAPRAICPRLRWGWAARSERWTDRPSQGRFVHACGSLSRQLASSRRAARLSATGALARNLPPIYELPYTDLVAPIDAGAAPLPLAAGAGASFISKVPADAPAGEPTGSGDPAEGRPGRIALLVAPEGELRHTLVVEYDGWSVACPLTKGQLHRLTNALDGRGTRSGIRPLSLDEEYVHLTGAPERLIVEAGERRVEIPAGPKRAMAKALRAAESADA